MYNKFSLILSLLLCSCQNPSDNQEITDPSDNQEITEIIYSTEGYSGMSNIRISKDSLRYYSYLNSITENKAYANNKELWSKIINFLDIKEFHKLKDGVSKQINDGEDVKLTIITKLDTHSVVNGEYDSKLAELIKFIREIQPATNTK